ncbi:MULTISPECIES: glycosyltransferase [Crateriforma]|uniref:UDP-Gal:alpha-D-GlcNAc-diphosphoundecaprenol beta-1,3-galactosyltransferase n=1 Tax=Crateriforma conspicua TaxID=2527996 RepID=A0A5C6G378_9PLAN|nr:MULTISPECIES: glycosyltransferase [Crateriforma]TWU67663.1 UDP-Gal:alpha-D-GlcNAc-diphosphoundecaprenol beta-1,3-galactosyltransferase [Crateriforma conspicua]
MDSRQDRSAGAPRLNRFHGGVTQPASRRTDPGSARNGSAPQTAVALKQSAGTPVRPSRATSGLRQNRFSVLMSVYRNDDPIHFWEAIDSVTAKQTRRPDEVILVVDGPVSEDLETVIDHWEAQPMHNVRVVRCKNNIGLAKAMNVGLQHCRYDYVARMDADDVSLSDRFEKQLSYLDQHPDISLLGGWYRQFDDQMQQCLTDRKVPAQPDAIKKYSRKRTPFNHVTAVFKRADLMRVGGYPSIDGLMEDWWIALRMIKQGMRLANLPEYHVNVRGDNAFMRRRGGWDYLRSEFANLTAMNREGLMSMRDLVQNLMIRSGVRIIPVGLRSMIYKAIRRV